MSSLQWVFLGAATPTATAASQADHPCILQRGVDLPSLDVTYFTSLSYYILLLFGLNGLLRMLFRDQASANLLLFP